jgi:hypothetical protein
MIRRREFIAGLGSAAVLPVVARAQQGALPVIGYLAAQFANDEYKNFTVPFLQGLKEAGYVEGQNVAIEYHWAENQYDRLPALAADLVRRRVAVIMAAGTPATLAAKEATTTIPIVFSTGSDPVALGLVASLNRPGANVTGIANLVAELGPKRLQLLRELLPNAAQLGVLADPAFPIPNLQSQTCRQRPAHWACNWLWRIPGPIAISTRPSQLFRNSMLVRSWSATVPSVGRLATRHHPDSRDGGNHWWRGRSSPSGCGIDCDRRQCCGAAKTIGIVRVAARYSRSSGSDVRSSVIGSSRRSRPGRAPHPWSEASATDRRRRSR